jgi:flagellar basal-body rod protein FlgF
VNPDGHLLLDEGGAPVFVPPDARNVALARDGTLSSDGVPLARVGLWAPRNPDSLQHEAGTRFTAAGGVEPVEEPVVLQGYLEESNVNPVSEIARMIEVQRAYEMGQSLLERDDERVRLVITTLGR